MKKLCILLVALLALLVSGCVRMDSKVDVDSDFSGTITGTIMSQGGPIKQSDVMDRLTKQVAKLNKDGNNANFDINRIKLSGQDAQGKSIKADNANASAAVWNFSVDFKNDKDLADIANVVYGAVTNKHYYNVIYPYGDDQNRYKFYLGKSPGNTVITVSGTVDKDSVKGGILKGDTVTFPENQEISFTFVKSSGVMKYVWWIIGIVVVGFGGFIAYKKWQYSKVV